MEELPEAGKKEMKQAKGTVYHMGEDPWWCAPLLSLFLPIPPGVQPLCWRRLPRVASLRQHFVARAGAALLR